MSWKALSCLCQVLIVTRLQWSSFGNLLQWQCIAAHFLLSPGSERNFAADLVGPTLKARFGLACCAALQLRISHRVAHFLGHAIYGIDGHVTA